MKIIPIIFLSIALSSCALRPIQDCKVVQSSGHLVKTSTGTIKLIPGEVRHVCNTLSPKKDWDDYWGLSYMMNWKVEE